ncbi:MAG: class I SAM-dependent methyltransferase [Hyphomonas sp.]|uniref:class I SAM-dependent methyltransferase n=1 Tax=Hyphomonas sp. TaxID=87 RepID=UPI003528998A
MSVPGIPKDFWNARFSEDGFAYGDRASRLLFAFRDLLKPGQSALVPACGEGRDAVFLAQCGLAVTAVDMSAAGLAKTQALAAAHGVTVTCLEADLSTWDWPVGSFDVIAAMFAHMPSSFRPVLHRRFLAALKPGGHVFLEGFLPAQIDYQKSHNSGGPHNVDFLFDPADIRADFAGAEELSLMTGIETLTEGPYHHGPAALLRAVFRKPETK